MTEEPLFQLPDKHEIADSVEKFSREVGGFEQTSGLLLCHSLACQMFKQGKAFYRDQHGSFISVWFLAYVAKELLLFSSDVIWNRRMTLDDLSRLAKFYLDRILDSEFKEPEDTAWKAKISWNIKVHYEQMVWQLPLRSYLARSHYTMFEHPWPKYRKQQQEFSDLFAGIYGIDTRAFYWITIGLLAQFHKAPGLDKAALARMDIPGSEGACTIENIDKVLGHLSVTYEEFCKEQGKCRHPHPWERKYELNYLRKRPIITNRNGDILSPIPRLIIDKMTDGIYYDIMDYCSENHIDFRKYATVLGSLFHGYVGLLFSHVYKLGVSLQDADDYFGTDARHPICDWILFEDDAVILIECKNSRLPLSVVSTGDADAFRSFFIERYLHNGKLQFKEPYEHFAKDSRKVFSLMVYNDTIGLYNAYQQILPDMPDLIESLREHKTQFISIGELESLLSTLEKTPLSKVLASKLSSSQTCHVRFNSFFRMKPEFWVEDEPAVLARVWEEIYGPVFDDATSPRN